MRMKYKDFEEYLYEMELYSTRSERLMAEFHGDSLKYERLVAWLRSAFESARAAENYQMSVNTERR